MPEERRIDASHCPEVPGEQWESQLDDDERQRAQLRVDEALRTAWVRRLLSEWKRVNWAQCRGAMRAPQIALQDQKRRWGTYDAHLRLLTISERQIACYTWTSVVETLKHEMAHQYVAEVLGVRDEAPHGPAFKVACKVLGADPRAASDGGTPLYRRVGALPGEPLDPQLRRIRKLLALADGTPSEAEANLAYRKANALLLKYNLSQHELAGEKGYVYRRLGAPSRRVQSRQYAVGQILRDFFFVETLWVSDYLAAEDREGRVLEVMGSAENVDMAEHVHATLHRITDELWIRYKRETGVRGISARREYADGLIEGFRSTLVSGRAESREQGLVWVGDPRLRAFVRERYPRVRTIRVDGVMPTSNHAAGREAGAKIRIHRPISSKGSGGGGLLGDGS